MGFQVQPKEAMILEGIQQRESRRRVMSNIYDSTYGPKSPTKKRRKLPGKRKWKDKAKLNAQAISDIVMHRYNDKELHRKTMNKVYKSNSENRSIADAIMRGDDPV